MKQFKQVKVHLSDVTCILSVVFNVSLLLLKQIFDEVCSISRGLEMTRLHYRKARMTVSFHIHQIMVMSHSSHSYNPILRIVLLLLFCFCCNCYFNDQISSHSNQGQLDDNCMPSCFPPVCVCHWPMAGLCLSAVSSSKKVALYLSDSTWQIIISVWVYCWPDQLDVFVLLQAQQHATTLIKYQISYSPPSLLPSPSQAFWE